MKAVILAGGLGTRLSEETTLKPKPMVEIGGKPIIWHIMKIYSAHGIHDFIICFAINGPRGFAVRPATMTASACCRSAGNNAMPDTVRPRSRPDRSSAGYLVLFLTLEELLTRLQ